MDIYIRSVEIKCVNHINSFVNILIKHLNTCKELHKHSQYMLVFVHSAGAYYAFQCDTNVTRLPAVCLSDHTKKN